MRHTLSNNEICIIQEKIEWLGGGGGVENCIFRILDTNLL